MLEALCIIGSNEIPYMQKFLRYVYFVINQLTVVLMETQVKPVTMNYVRDLITMLRKVTSLKSS